MRRRLESILLVHYGGLGRERGRFGFPARVPLVSVEGAAETVRALLSREWSIIAFDLTQATAKVLELAAAVDTTSAGPLARPQIRVGVIDGNGATLLGELAGLDRIVDLAEGAPAWGPICGYEPEDDMNFEAAKLVERMMGNEKLARRVVSAFLADTPRQLLALADAVERADFERGRRAAHSLKGSASNAGGEGMVDTVKQLEAAFAEQRIEQARRLVPGVVEEFAQVKTEMEDYLESSK